MPLLKITKKVFIDKDSYKENTHFSIRYENDNYMKPGVNPKNNKRTTWHSKSFLKQREALKYKTRYCEDAIKGIRENKSTEYLNIIWKRTILKIEKGYFR